MSAQVQSTSLTSSPSCWNVWNVIKGMKNVVEEYLTSDTLTREKVIRVYNAATAAAVSGSLIYRLYTTPNQIIEVFELIEYGSDIVLHAAQACTSEKSNSYWKAALVGLNALRMGQIILFQEYGSTIPKVLNLVDLDFNHPLNIIYLLKSLQEDFSSWAQDENKKST